MTVTLLEGHVTDVLAGLPAGHFHTVCTSPPYWQLRAYGTAPQVWPDGWVGELGQEESPEVFVAHLVEVFRAVRRVLRQDGSVWVNLAGSYYTEQPGGQNGTTGTISAKAIEANRQQGRWRKPAHPIYRGLDWVDVPGLFARAMQQDGWTWRSDVVWVKPSALPESVSGTRWERCRTKVAMNKHRDPQGRGGEQRMLENPEDHRGINPDWLAEWADCPGCPKCAPDGLVLRRGSGRPTKSTERILLFTRGPGYYFDQEAVRERPAEATIARLAQDVEHQEGSWRANGGGKTNGPMRAVGDANGRNLRDWWVIGPEPLKDAHYAAYPSALPERCIRAGTSEWGCCPVCGAPWARVVDRGGFYGNGNPVAYADRPEQGSKIALSGEQLAAWKAENPTVTLGWRPTCRCLGVAETPPVPARVLDIFGGSGTTALAANRLGRDCTLVELKSEYAELARKRVGREPLSLFAWQGQESMASAEEEPPALGTTKQEQHPTRTVTGPSTAVEGAHGAGGTEETPEEVLV